ncbi:HPF/RaiA family ribosome-associated protein [Streptosporangium sp. NPDC000396]|uniref:HPF/RaiA family ribosome-associated protein n=1 Tax=Streptosporangium sp. NPDC000396 TaxID=3366185 RepID=UPI0036AEC1BA
MQDVDDEETPAVAERLRLGAGFTEADRDEIVERFVPLRKRLRSFPKESVDLQLSVKNRDQDDQRVTLECRVSRVPPLVATSTAPELPAALIEVRDELIRQLDKLKTRRDPRGKAPYHRP